jgi:hypothetical protein
VYYINPTGTSSSSGIFQVYCDMTTDGGGWTMVGNFRKTGEPYNIWSTWDIVKWENGKLSDNVINLIWKNHFLFSVVWKTEKIYCKNFIFNFSDQTMANDKTTCSRVFSSSYAWYVTNWWHISWYPISHWNARDLWIRDNSNLGTRIQMDDGNVVYWVYDIKMFAR